MRRILLAFVLAGLGAAGSEALAAEASIDSFEWLSRMERLQAERGDPARHVHFDARVESVDRGSGSVTMVHPEMRSGDGSIVMPRMHMTFHAIAFSKLRGIAAGDVVHTVIGRHKGAIMVTEIRKLQ
ncbi:copper-binding protein [Methylorubrum populi]|uniref:Copper-binding protein n=1 Tax=Methylorubrum rhodesianum TaxID=29427 RepID=A0ABU9Z5H5_9HYPH|nr:copper-binding protein [Methylorubrum rhodesianum]MBK3404974.1 copper-binding protein [Methylorubrum rhodesianum]MBY0144015.1 copper-binding protein [Methylorubrum populi]